MTTYSLKNNGLKDLKLVTIMCVIILLTITLFFSGCDPTTLPKDNFSVSMEFLLTYHLHLLELPKSVISVQIFF